VIATTTAGLRSPRPARSAAGGSTETAVDQGPHGGRQRNLPVRSGPRAASVRQLRRHRRCSTRRRWATRRNGGRHVGRGRRARLVDAVPSQSRVGADVGDPDHLVGDHCRVGDAGRRRPDVAGRDRRSVAETQPEGDHVRRALYDVDLHNRRRHRQRLLLDASGDRGGRLRERVRPERPLSAAPVGSHSASPPARCRWRWPSSSP